MIQIIGWTLLHSLWQILLVATLYWLIKNSWRSSSSWRQYYLAVSALGTAFVAPILTFCYLLKEQLIGPVLNSIPEITTPIASTSMETSNAIVETSLTFSQQIAIYFPGLVACWGIGVLYFAIRLYKSIQGIKQLQNSDKQLLTPEWLAKIDLLKETNS